MTIKANGIDLKTDHVYRTANSRRLPKWQRNRGVVFLRTLEEKIEGFTGDVAVVMPLGEHSQFMIPAGLLAPIN